jgi:hypothetical protein
MVINRINKWIISHLCLCSAHRLCKLIDWFFFHNEIYIKICFILLQSLLYQTYHITCIILKIIIFLKLWWVKYASASFQCIILLDGPNYSESYILTQDGYSCLWTPHYSLMNTETEISHVKMLIDAWLSQKMQSKCDNLTMWELNINNRVYGLNEAISCGTLTWKCLLIKFYVVCISWRNWDWSWMWFGSMVWIYMAVTHCMISWCLVVKVLINAKFT